MFTNEKYVTIRIKNGGTYRASATINYYKGGSIHKITIPLLKPGMLFTGKISENAQNIVLTVFNLSAPKPTEFCKESLPYTMNSCFLLEGTNTTPICIPVPCS